MRESGFSRTAQAIIAKMTRTSERQEAARRGVTLSELHSRQGAAEAKAHQQAERLLRTLR